MLVARDVAKGRRRVKAPALFPPRRGGSAASTFVSCRGGGERRRPPGSPHWRLHSRCFALALFKRRPKAACASPRGEVRSHAAALPPSSRRRIDRRFLFHVKHLLPDAEVAEDHVEDVLDVDPSGDPSEPARGEPELLRHEILLAARSLLNCALQRLDGF